MKMSVHTCYVKLRTVARTIHENMRVHGKDAIIKCVALTILCKLSVTLIGSWVAGPIAFTGILLCLKSPPAAPQQPVRPEASLGVQGIPQVIPQSTPAVHAPIPHEQYSAILIEQLNEMDRLLLQLLRRAFTQAAELDKKGGQAEELPRRVLDYGMPLLQDVHFIKNRLPAYSRALKELQKENARLRMQMEDKLTTQFQQAIERLLREKPEFQRKLRDGMVEEAFKANDALQGTLFALQQDHDALRRDYRLLQNICLRELALHSRIQEKEL